MNISNVKGKLINEGTFFEREIKLFCSPDPRANIVRDGYGCGMTIIQPGKGHEVHTHPDSEETILVVSGQGTATIDGKDVEVKPMQIIGLGKNESHGFANTGDEPLCMYWIYTPPGPEAKFIVE